VSLARRSALASISAFFAAAICAGGVEVYPGPGGNAYQSNFYQVEVFDSSTSTWRSAYVYGFTRQSVCHWHYGGFPTVNFLTFGTTGPVDVRVTLIAGPVTAVDVSPHSKNIPRQVTGGRAVLTLNPNTKAWITVNGDDANSLFVFADAPKPPVPSGATYVGPGVVTVPGVGNHYKASNNEVIYLDGGAWVRGNIDVHGTTNVRIMGPGVLSGELWTGETINPLPFAQFTNYAMITGDFAGDAASVQGITILDSPGYNFWGGATSVSGVKILSPWFFSTDGFQGVSHVDQSFVFNGDNIFTPGWAGVQGQNLTFTSCFVGTTNNAVFAGGYWGNAGSNRYTSFADDIDIKTYSNDDWVPGSPLLPAAFQVWVDNSDSTMGYANQTYQNVRIEGNISEPLLQLKNVVYPWSGGFPDPPLGNSYNLTFKNITLEGTQKYRSEIKGWNATNGFHHVVLENVRINGTVVDSSNVASYFDVNSYVWTLAFTTAGADLFSLAPCRLVDTRRAAGPMGGPALSAGQDRVFTLVGQCGLPAGAAAVSINATVTQPTADGYLTIYPGGTALPIASLLNYRAGQTRANNGIMPLGPSGEVVVHCGQATGTTQFILDVNAYFQ